MTTPPAPRPVSVYSTDIMNEEFPSHPAIMLPACTSSCAPARGEVVVVGEGIRKSLRSVDIAA